MKEIVFAGSGGQGVLTCGLIFSDIAVSKDLNVTWSPSYGSAMRGGTANCTVKYGAGYIYNPQQEEPDVVLAMNDASFQMFSNIVAPGGTMVISDVVDANACTRDDIKIVIIPCMKLANDLENPRGANIIMTGAITKLMGEFTAEEAVAAMHNMFNKKGKNRFAEANEAAFKAGFEAI